MASDFKKIGYTPKNPLARAAFTRRLENAEEFLKTDSSSRSLTSGAQSEDRQREAEADPASTTAKGARARGNTPSIEGYRQPLLVNVSQQQAEEVYSPAIRKTPYPDPL